MEKAVMRARGEALARSLRVIVRSVGCVCISDRPPLLTRLLRTMQQLRSTLSLPSDAPISSKKRKRLDAYIVRLPSPPYLVTH